ncbi:SgcJ/EcaC family oxidoreductase [Amycolatopsis pittospori]|uniref:SgcJ/EcaC family oxidoreductase n=1 Tax=Amycolatopsis pittospori TaxID=2749434 RepID=UPI0015EFEE85|nr:SgcJ/EcaC family oxidoreductase [Amycolatopsis pittospori]
MTTEEIITALERAWNTGDGEAWAARFAEDAEFVDVVGRIQRGRATIARESQNIFDTIYRGSTLEIRQVSSRPLGGGIDLVHTATVLTIPAGPLAGEARAVQTKLIRDGEIVAFHNTIRTDIAAFAGHDADLAARSPQEWDS